MKTYRDYYFYLIKKNKKIFTKEVIFSLLCDDFGGDTTSLSINFDNPVNNQNELDEYIAKIEEGIPYQYVLGYTYFLSNKFIVNPDVLIPRQETEQLVLDTIDIVKNKLKLERAKILDLCSGSGCIGISLAKALNADATLIDISENANKIAKENAILNKTKVEILQSDMFNNIIDNDYNVIVCNPPYIKDSSSVDEATLKYEPHLALFASPYTYFYEEVFKNYKKYTTDECVLCFEIGEDMEFDLTSLINRYFDNPKYEFRKDIYDKLRFLYIFINN